MSGGGRTGGSEGCGGSKHAAIVSGVAVWETGLLETAEPSSLGPICFTTSGGPVLCCFENTEVASFTHFWYGELLYRHCWIS